MKLTEQINAQIKEAMLARQEARLRGLRSIKSAFLLAATEKGASEELTDDKAISVLQKLAKQRKDSMDIYIQNNRPELALKEQEELDVISSFLPAQMSPQELTNELKIIIEEVGAKSPSDVGKVIPVAMKKLGAQSDGKTISTLVKELLS